MRGRNLHRLLAGVAKRGVQFIGKTEVAGSGTVNYPAGTQSGDRLVLIVASDAAITAPGSWTQNVNFGWSIATHWTAWFNRACAGETSVTSGASANGGAILLVYRSPIARGLVVGNFGSLVQSSGGTATIDCGGISPFDFDTLVIGTADEDSAAALPTNPGAGWLDRANVSMTIGKMLVSEKRFFSTSATGTQSFTKNNSAHGAVGVIQEVRS